MRAACAAGATLLFYYTLLFRTFLVLDPVLVLALLLFGTFSGLVLGGLFLLALLAGLIGRRNATLRCDLDGFTVGCCL